MTETKTDFPAGIAVVAGGSGGIGSAICAKLAEAGTDVAFTYRNNQEAAKSVTKAIEAAGKNGYAYPVAVEDEHQVKNLFDTIAKDHGPIHTVVNATGVHIDMVFVNQTTHEQWREVIDKEVNGFFNIVQASLPYLKEHGGSYVTISTVGLKRWPTKDVLSVAPKAAVEALIKGIAREEGKFGIRANIVELGLIDAGLFQKMRGAVYSEAYIEAAVRNTALKRLGTAEEVADAVIFFASDKARYLTGQTLVLDGGFSL